METRGETKDIRIAFGRDVAEDPLRARELYLALCKNRWEAPSGEVLEFSWRQAGDFVSAMREGETYLDYYASGGEGTVSPWVLSRFRSLGYRRLDR